MLVARLKGCVFLASFFKEHSPTMWENQQRYLADHKQAFINVLINNWKGKLKHTQTKSDFEPLNGYL